MCVYAIYKPLSHLQKYIYNPIIVVFALNCDWMGCIHIHVITSVDFYIDAST